MFAIGVPKGKMNKSDKEHKFYTLYLNALNKQKGYRLLQYTSYDNIFLSNDDIEELEREIGNMNPQMVQQEIYGKFVDESFNALWQPEMIRKVDALPALKRVVLGVDPTASKDGDKVGIIGAGLGYDGNAYVFHDTTGNYTPAQWGTIVYNSGKEIQADCIVAEKNQGGEMVEYVIRQYDPITRIILVHAIKGKELRAEPIVSLYEQSKVFHTGNMWALENEMLTWIPGQGSSPNRIDAMVYALIELMLKPLTEYRDMNLTTSSRRL